MITSSTPIAIMDSPTHPPLPDEWRDILIDDLFEKLTHHVTSFTLVDGWLSSQNTIEYTVENDEKIISFMALDNTNQPYTTNQLARLIAKSLIFDGSYNGTKCHLDLGFVLMESICRNNYLETEHEYKIFKKQVLIDLSREVDPMPAKVKDFWEQLQDLWYNERPGTIP